MSIHRTRTNRLGGGVSIYIHDSIKLVWELDSLFTDTFESCAVELNFHGQSILMAEFLGGLSLHLNHLIASGMTIYDWPFGTLPFRLFGSNLDTRDLETYPRTYSGHF